MTTDNNGGRLFLRSVRIDNYKCFSDFEMSFGDFTLLLGKNGCGKTAVFESINALSRFVCHSVRVEDAFPFLDTLTRWRELGSDTFKQSFELRVSDERGGNDFCYQLILEHTFTKQFIEQYKREGKTRVASETLTLGNDALFAFSDGKVRLRHSKGGHSGEVEVPFDPSVSGLTHVGLHNGDHNLHRFYEWLNSITLLSLAPDRMERGSNEGAQYPNADGSNFASWYRWIISENPAAMEAADDSLRRVLPGYRCLELVRAGGESYYELRAVFASENGKEQNYAFTELSAGQKVLIALYCFLYGGGCNRLLLLDEPDNFITLPEVQPLLLDIAEEAGDELPQVAMISHHPDAIDSISPEERVWMAREPEQPARIVKFENNTRLHTSELYAQGAAP